MNKSQISIDKFVVGLCTGSFTRLRSIQNIRNICYNVPFRLTHTHIEYPTVLGQTSNTSRDNTVWN